MTSGEDSTATRVGVVKSVLGSINGIAKDSKERANVYVSTIERYLGHALGTKTHALALAAVSGLAVTSSIAARASSIGLENDNRLATAHADLARKYDLLLAEKSRSETGKIEDTSEARPDAVSQERIDLLTGQLAQSKTLQDGQLAQSKALQDELDRNAIEVNHLRKEIAELIAQLSVRDSEIVNLKSKIDEESQKHCTKAHEMETTMARLSAEQERSHSLEKELKHSLQQMTERDAALQDKTKQLSAREQELLQLRSELHESSEKHEEHLRELLSNASRSAEEHKVEINRLRTISADFSKELKDLKHDHAKVMQEKTEYIAKLQASTQQERLHAQEGESKAMADAKMWTAKLDKTTEEMSDLMSTHKQSQVENAALAKELEDLKNAYTLTNEHQARQLARHRVHEDSRVADLQEQHQKIVRRLEEERIQQTSLHHSEIQDLEESHAAVLEHMTGNLQKVHSALSELQGKHKIVLENNKKLQSQAAILEKEVTELQVKEAEERSEHTRQVQSMRQVVQDRGVLVESLQRQLTQLGHDQAETDAPAPVEHSKTTSTASHESANPRALGNVLSNTHDDDTPARTSERLTKPAFRQGVNFSRRQPSINHVPRDEGRSSPHGSPLHHDELYNASEDSYNRSPPRRRSNSSAAKVHALTGDIAATESLSSSSQGTPPHSPNVPQSPRFNKESGFKGLIRRTSGKLKRTSNSSRSVSIASPRTD